MIVLELVDARVRDLGLSIIDNRSPLEVLDTNGFRLEAERAPRQMTEFVVKERVDRTGVVDGRLAHVGNRKRRVQPHLDVRMVEHPLEDGVVSVGRDALQVVLEVVDVVVVPHRHALDDRGVDLLRGLSPLLGRVPAEERVEDRRRMALVLHEFRDFAGLQLHAEELVYEREAEREVVYLPFVVREHLVLVAVEVGEAADEVPHRLVVRVEDVAAVEVHLDAGLGICRAADVSADRAARLQHEHPAPRFREPARHRAAPEARTGDYSVKFFVRLHCAYYSILWYNVRMAQVPKTSVSLLKDLASGTESARWAEFVRMYEEPMRSFLAARFPSVEADDVLQETMIALMRVMPGYHYTPDSGGHFRNYLAGILKHKAEDAIRRRERESGRRERMRRSAADAPRDDGIAARERTEEDEWRLAAMNAALEQLLSDESVNARSREVFRHVALLHEPPAEVAAAFGISRANVDTIKRRLVLRLSELVRSMTDDL